MTEPHDPFAAAPAPAPAPATGPVPVAAPAPSPLPGRWIAVGAAVLAAAAAASLMLAWDTQQRVKTVESELVRRQQDSSAQAAEARLAAREALDVARESAAKMALLEARVAETTMQRTQLEDLIQSLARSRDENVLADVDAALRVAMQQSAITGSVDPLVITLRQADERLARYNQPRLESVRRAVARDLEKTRAAGGADIAALALRLDDAVRLVDELPLLADVAGRERGAPEAADAASAPVRRRTASAKAPASAAASASSPGAARWLEPWREMGEYLWQQTRSLVRVTRIEAPEAMFIAPEQGYFLRENLKLRLLNARLALLSRQFDTTQADLRDAQAALQRYFDPGSRRVGAADALLRQVAAQARLVSVPRPDATLAAIATASAGR